MKYQVRPYIKAEVRPEVLTRHIQHAVNALAYYARCKAQRTTICTRQELIDKGLLKEGGAQ